ncbi:MAG: chorismate synthase [Tenuifilaceae bacterium]
MNSFGRIFRVSLFGESHGRAIGVVVDGVKPGLPLSTDDFADDIRRRGPGLPGTTPRTENDLPEMVSGWLNGYTTGAPLAIIFRNTNVRSHDYERIKDLPRPGHADFVAYKKFSGYNDYRGGGHFSGRITLALVAAGVIAKKMIDPVEVHAKLVTVGGSTDIENTINKAMSANDSVGGLVECRVSGIPIGWGEPFFDSVESVISHLAFAIPGVKGIEFGSGFAAASMFGSAHNDAFIDASGATSSNNAGGILGGISNGNELQFRVAVKPTSSIAREQQTINMRTGMPEKLVVTGRHDTCIALRVPVVLEAVAAIALADLAAIQNKSKG